MTNRDELVARALRGVKPGSSGWVRVPCPFCAERTGKPDRKSAFGYNIDSKFFHCFKCGVRGRVSGAGLPAGGEREDRPKVELEEPSSYYPLWEYPGSTAMSTINARMYLSNRGIAPEMWRQARIGAALSGDHAGRVITPILDDLGKEWLGWVGRAWLPKAELPYYYARGMDRAELIYNEAALRVGSENPVVVVEGVFDTFPVWPDGVALLGKASDMQVDSLLETARPIAVVLDGDAWMEGLALAMTLRMRGHRAGAVRLPPGRDPDEVSISWLWGQIWECLNK